MGIELDFETADRIAVSVMRDQLEYLKKEQEWFESDQEKRKELKKEWGHEMYVHGEDYAKNAREYIPALELLIKYFGG